MGPLIGNPPPLLPRLDLPYFTLLPFFEGNGHQCLYITAAPPPNEGLYPFERVPYAGLLAHLSGHPALQPLWQLESTRPALRTFGDGSPFPSAEVLSWLRDSRGLEGTSLEALLIVVLSTPEVDQLLVPDPDEHPLAIQGEQEDQPMQIQEDHHMQIQEQQE